MLSSNFFLFVGIAILSYGLQAPLLAYFTRKHGSLVVIVYRNIFLAFIMLPALFLLQKEEVMLIGNHLDLLLPASAFGVVALTLNLNAFKYLPVAMANILRQVSDVVLAIIIGAIFLHEYLVPSQLFLIGLIISCGCILAITRSPRIEVLMPRTGIGLLFATLAGFSHAFSFFFFSKLVRATNPIAAGYFWEVFIGIFAASYLIFLYKRKKFLLPIKLPLQTIVPIGLASVVTISGTLAYGYAVTVGPYALATGLITSSVVVVLLASSVFLKEKLALKQVALMLTIVAFMIILRINS